MTGPQLPEKGDRITIRWPGGPHDFVMIYEDQPSGWRAPIRDFAWLRGLIVEPSPSGWHDRRVLYARPTGRPGEYELLGDNAPDPRKI